MTAIPKRFTKKQDWFSFPILFFLNFLYKLFLCIAAASSVHDSTRQNGLTTPVSKPVLTVILILVSTSPVLKQFMNEKLLFLE